ncbi:MAG: ComF family protein [Candidatus Desulfatibia sp.]|uniref:ComF family protein n=1 Tax=Candidatus Desulfatibia sp. TaxID=3101189 RepID=UPI002F343DAA
MRLPPETRNILSRLTGVIKDVLFPAQCLVCGAFFHHDLQNKSCLSAEVLQAGTAPDFEKVMAPFLCRVCSKDFVAAVSPMCTVCGIMFQSREGEDHICGECLTSPKLFGMARSLGAYERALMAVIHRMKYAGKVQVARPLGKLLFFAFIRYWGISRIDLVIPVPLHASKIRKRGFNQSFLLVRGWASMAEALKIELPFIKVDGRIFIRKRWTEPQTGLDKKKRLKNIKNAFGVSESAKMEGKRILLVDDVYTTGATVNECAKVLLGAGARRVDVLTLAQAL